MSITQFFTVKHELPAEVDPDKLESYHSLISRSNVNTNTLPSEVASNTYIRIIDQAKYCKYEDDGMWLFFYPYEKLDEMWKKAKEYYDRGILFGISTIAVVHSGINKEGCIQFACTNTESKLKDIIKMLISHFNTNKDSLFYKDHLLNSVIYKSLTSNLSSNMSSSSDVDNSGTSNSSVKRSYSYMSDNYDDIDRDNGIRRAYVSAINNNDSNNNNTRPKKYTWKVNVRNVKRGRFMLLS